MSVFTRWGVGHGSMAIQQDTLQFMYTFPTYGQVLHDNKREPRLGLHQELFCIIFFPLSQSTKVARSRHGGQVCRGSRGGEGRKVTATPRGHRLTSRLESQGLAPGCNLRGSKKGCFRASAKGSRLAGSYSSMPSMRSNNWWCSCASDERYRCKERGGGGVNRWGQASPVSGYRSPFTSHTNPRPTLLRRRDSA